MALALLDFFKKIIYVVSSVSQQSCVKHYLPWLMLLAETMVVDQNG